MLEPVFDYVRQLFAVKRQTENNTDDIKEVREEVKVIAAAVQRLEFRTQLLKDTTKRD